MTESDIKTEEEYMFDDIIESGCNIGKLLKLLNEHIDNVKRQSSSHGKQSITRSQAIFKCTQNTLTGDEIHSLNPDIYTNILLNVPMAFDMLINFIKNRPDDTTITCSEILSSRIIRSVYQQPHNLDCDDFYDVLFTSLPLGTEPPTDCDRKVLKRWIDTSGYVPSKEKLEEMRYLNAYTYLYLQRLNNLNDVPTDLYMQMLKSPDEDFKDLSGRNVIDYVLSYFNAFMLPDNATILAQMPNVGVAFGTTERALQFLKDVYRNRALKENAFYQQYSEDLPRAITTYTFFRIKNKQ